MHDIMDGSNFPNVYKSFFFLASFLKSCRFIVVVFCDFLRNADRILRQEKWREVQKSITPMLDLEIIRIVSEISENHLILLLSQCINVKEIFMGMSTSISDKVWSEV